MTTSSTSGRDLLGRRGFLVGVGTAGTGAALGTGVLLTRGGPAAGPVPPRPALMTAALGTPLATLPHAVEQARAAGNRAGGAAGRAAAAATALRPFVDRLPVPPVLRGRDGALTVSLRTASVRLHRDLPATRLWTYEGSHLGPTIEARSGSRLRVAWENDLTGAFPVPAVRVPFSYEEGRPLMWDRPGREGGTPREDVAALPPWTAVHLHGAVTGGGNDGWAENAVLPADAQLSEYRNQQRASGLWYHDHAMHITHLNVMTGLAAGQYLVRDDEEAGLRLPRGERELPLVLFDRNLDLDADGGFTGGLLYKGIVVVDDPYELVRPFTGPFTLVNGKIWPYQEVDAGWYRLRLLNASNNRPYLLKLLDEEGRQVPPEAFVQIGTDAGLLPAPAPLKDGVSLTPAERADVLVDFSRYRGQRLRLANTLPEPGIRAEVLEFRVGSRAEGGGYSVPGRLARSFRPVDRGKLAGTRERMVMVTPVYPKDPELWEMEETEAPQGELPIDGIVQFEDALGRVRTFRRVSSTYDDPVAFTVPAGSTERWTFLSLEQSEGSYPHPMHLHATAFQGLSRDLYDVSTFTFFEREGGGYGAGTSAPLRRKAARALTPAEKGPKDTIALYPAEMITVAAEFQDVPGRFMHHCHIYEHEDMMMMRPFVVQPRQVIALAPHGAHGTPPSGGTSAARHGQH
ncbi:multicopper oxidase family protein [Streptomyces tagetis]|uniref:Multicopper oxidase domain-containing protein n=1 Tax=Streptomyces tagetis TaxID=2820809 RepID=A0A940XDA8_9ACTN|nr:multicopper oxidase domain-containing protein [Streptomyces sp. RG38]MBQ0826111.1 multicopper oxidase domain-containing protein [Streptomyces sp. RG38]